MLACVIAIMLWSVVQLVSADTARQPWKVDVVQTNSDLSKRLSAMPTERFVKQIPAGIPVIHVDDGVRYQTIKGVGGAMTDSSAYLIRNKLEASAQLKLMKNLFSSSGAGMSFIRLPMAASDFTADGQPYTYDDLPTGSTDPSLAHFSVAHDDAYIVPAMREAMKINPATKVIATPWSPPAWMKTNGALGDLGYAGYLRPGDQKVLAEYFVKFVQAYAKRGIPIAAVTPENEPRAPASYPAMAFPEPAEVTWIISDLIPALKAAKLPTKVYGGDTSFNATTYALDLAQDAGKSGLYGVAQHCYHGIPYLLGKLHAAAPSLDLLVSECAIDLTPYSASEIVIGSMRNWASAVGIWNLALNPSGGPVQAPDTGCVPCRGIVTVDGTTHTVTYNLAYYQLGQVGRFVKPGAQRIASDHFVGYYQGAPSNSYGATQGVDDLAVRNPDGSLALVAYNNADHTQRFAVSWRGRAFTDELPAHATVTFSWNRVS